MKFVCIDTETTGLNPRNCEIVELSYQPWENFKRGPMVNHVFTAVGNPDTDSFRGAAKINGYEPEARKLCPTLRYNHIADLFRAVDDASENKVAVVVGANPGFDWGFVTAAAERMGVPLPKGRVRLVDVASLAVPMLAAGKVESLSLRDLVKLVGKTQGDGAGGGHTSKQDVELTIDVFEFICRAYVKALVSP